MTLQQFLSYRGVRLLKLTAEAWMEDKALRLGAALSYYSIFSIAPLLIIAVSVAGFLLGPHGSEEVQRHMEEQMGQYVGQDAAAAIQSMIRSSSKPADGWTASIIGFCTLLLGASGVFAQLQDALNTIWGVQAKSGSGILGMVWDRLLNFGMVLAMGFLLLISLSLTTALAAFSGYVERTVGIPPFASVILAFAVSLCVATLLFAVIFKVLPDAHIQWRHVWLGAGVTALLFEAGKFGLSYYLGREGTITPFGAAGSMVALLIWIYYASAILLFGAEFTRIYVREIGEKVAATTAATPVTQEARAREGLTPAKEP